MNVHYVDLATRKITDIPNSYGLWSPRWSPDGKYIAAPSFDGTNLSGLEVARLGMEKCAAAALYRECDVVAGFALHLSKGSEAGRLFRTIPPPNIGRNFGKVVDLKRLSLGAGNVVRSYTRRHASGAL